LGLAPGTLVKAGEGSKQVALTPKQQELAAANLYRDANSMLYADNKPSEEAIDRVVAKLNKEYVNSPPSLTLHSSVFMQCTQT
jgi:pre-mRNA-splicing factor SYF2